MGAIKVILAFLLVALAGLLVFGGYVFYDQYTSVPESFVKFNFNGNSNLSNGEMN